MSIETAISLVMEKLQRIQDDEQFNVASLRRQVKEAIKSLQNIEKSLASHDQGSWRTDRWAIDLLLTLQKAEDALETFFFETTMKKRKVFAKAFSACHFKTLYKYSFSKKMEDFMQKLEDVEKIRQESSHEVEDMDFSHHEVQQNSEEEDIVGREAEMERLEQCTFYDELGLLIKVVGEAGSGKTTLVKKFYNLHIKQKFDFHAWVCVSKIFNVENLLVEILEQLKEKDEHKWPLELKVLQKETRKFLADKKYVVVLDDVQTAYVWDELKEALPNSLNGSKVILTVRDENVARLIDPSPPLQVDPLSSDASWKLFSKKVKNGTNEELESFKKEVLQNCRGLPLAILLLGGFLSNKKSSAEWSNVIQNIRVNYSISSILDLVYQGIIPSLRAFLSYLCLFPKSKNISVRRLSLLWLAEGLVKPSKAETSGDLVKKYLQELEKLNMIEVTRWWLDGEPKTCRVMSTVYDRFFKIAQRTEFFSVLLEPNSESGTPNSIYRLIQYSDMDIQFIQDVKIQRLHTFISFCSGDLDEPTNKVGELLKRTITQRGYGLVRVLDLEGVYKPELSETLGKLPLLKYVGLRRTFLDSIPESIGDLQHLETLDVKHTGITMLPTNLWKSKTLQHLYMDGIHIEMKDGRPLVVGSLTNLRTLWGLLIGNENPAVEWLKDLGSLRKLGLTCHTRPLVKMLTNWIRQLIRLKSLKLRSRGEDRDDSSSNMIPMDQFTELTDLYLQGKLPTGFISMDKLPPNLKILTLSSSKLSDDPMKVLGRLDQLNVLRLHSNSYNGESMNCLPRGFPKLRVLSLWMLNELKQWTIGEEAMPVLAELEIRYCKNLEKPNGLETVTSLKKVTLTNMKQGWVDELKRRLGDKVKKQDLKFNPSRD